MGVARKFSLKDNPIFQRLQVPGKKADDSQPGVRGIIEDPADLPQDEGTDSREGQYLRVENRPSNFDPQIESPDEAARKVKDIPADKLKDEFARDRVTSGRHSSDE